MSAYLLHRTRVVTLLSFIFLSCKTQQQNFTNAYQFSKYSYRYHSKETSKADGANADTTALLCASVAPPAMTDTTVAPVTSFSLLKDSTFVSKSGGVHAELIAKSSADTTITKTKKNRTPNKPANDAKKRRLAIIIGASLLLMAIVAGLTVPPLSGLFVLNNVALTAARVTSNFRKFSTAVGGWLTILVLDLLAALGVYKYYKKENPGLAKLTGGLRLAYSGVLGVGISHLLRISPNAPAASIYRHMDMFHTLWGWGLILFGFHLITLGIVSKNEGGKKWVNTTIRTLLIVAGLGYLIQYVGILLVSNPVTFTAFIEPIFIVPMILGELSYAVWKLVKGGKIN